MGAIMGKSDFLSEAETSVIGGLAQAADMPIKAPPPEKPVQFLLVNDTAASSRHRELTKAGRERVLRDYRIEVCEAKRTYTMQSSTHDARIQSGNGAGVASRT